MYYLLTTGIIQKLIYELINKGSVVVSKDGNNNLSVPEYTVNMWPSFLAYIGNGVDEEMAALH